MPKATGKSKTKVKSNSGEQQDSPSLSLRIHYPLSFLRAPWQSGQGSTGLVCGTQTPAYFPSLSLTVTHSQSPLPWRTRCSPNRPAPCLAHRHRRVCEAIEVCQVGTVKSTPVTWCCPGPEHDGARTGCATGRDGQHVAPHNTGLRPSLVPEHWYQLSSIPDVPWCIAGFSLQDLWHSNLDSHTCS